MHALRCVFMGASFQYRAPGRGGVTLGGALFNNVIFGVASLLALSHERRARRCRAQLERRDGGGGEIHGSQRRQASRSSLENPFDCPASLVRVFAPFPLLRLRLASTENLWAGRRTLGARPSAVARSNARKASTCRKFRPLWLRLTTNLSL